MGIGNKLDNNHKMMKSTFIIANIVDALITV